MAGADRSTSEVLLPGSGSATLSMTLQLPEREHDGPVPVMLTSDPYRKDDLGVSSGDTVTDRLIGHGYACARLDVRGSGRSGGTLPSEEYSTDEIEDIAVAIGWLAAQPWCSGAVGLWGISWSANNALLAATRNPPALRTCVAVHPCDDLFGRDIHLIDGMAHLDRYHVFIDLVNAVTRSPDYPTDEGALGERFDQPPWMMRWLEHPTRDAFWTERSLDGRYDQVNVPVLAVAGWYDGYRDCTFALLDRLHVPVQAVIGPWSHVLPHAGGPGPALDWFPLLLEWLDRWMGLEPGVEPSATRRVLLYRRDAGSHQVADIEPAAPEWQPEPERGDWYAFDAWPPRSVTTRSLGLGAASLGWIRVDEPEAEPITRRQPIVIDSDPWTGTEAGHWWGEATPDQHGDGATAFDSPVLDVAVEILGAPILHIDHGVAGARLFARLVDVAPDGRARLVTGGGLDLGHGGDDAPRILPMRSTSWTFAPGHRIRLLLTTALWPLAWPLGRRSPVTFEMGGARVELPVFESQSCGPPCPPPPFGSDCRSTLDVSSPAATDAARADTWLVVSGASGATLTWGPPGSARRTGSLRTVRSDDPRDAAMPTVDWGLSYAVRMEGAKIRADAHGDGAFVVMDGAGRILTWRTRLSISSVGDELSYDFERTLDGGGATLRHRRWARTFTWGGG